MHSLCTHYALTTPSLSPHTLFTQREKHLFFKHQRKEEDYELQPGWLPQLSALHKKIGWEFFDQGIRRGQVVDYGESGLRKTAPLSGVPVIPKASA
jgi:hypothetical protein